MLNCLQPVDLKKVCRIFLATLALICCSVAAFATEAKKLEDLLDDFEETPVVVQEAFSSSKSNPLAEYFSGYVKLFAAGNTTSFRPEPDKCDWKGLSSLRLETMLEVDHQLADWNFFGSIRGFYDFAYPIKGRDNFTTEVLNSYENELELRELYLQGSLTDHIDLKIGRQIVVWGRSDNIRVTDILNPLDNRDIGITDIENIRLPLTMIKLDVFMGDWNLDLLSVLEHRYSENPVYGHFFYPGSAPGPIENKPDNTLKNSEIGMELSRSFKSLDISFYGAHFYNDKGTYTSTNPLTMEHKKITMAGASASYARGNVLYIAELAHFRGLRFMASDQDYARTDFLIGIEYCGLTDTTINLDYARRYLHHYNAVLDTTPEKPKQTENEFALRIARECFHERLELTALFLLNGDHGQYGTTQRFTARYDISDNWSATAGVLLYQARDGPLTANGDTGRVYSELRYDF